MSELCGDPECGDSTGTYGGPTFGKGKLDEFGYWEYPCPKCESYLVWII